VKFVLNSTDGYHTFTVDELGINIIAPGIGTVTQEVNIPNRPGTYQVYCAPHKVFGMTASLIVTP